MACLQLTRLCGKRGFEFQQHSSLGADSALPAPTLLPESASSPSHGMNKLSSLPLTVHCTAGSPSVRCVRLCLTAFSSPSASAGSLSRLAYGSSSQNRIGKLNLRCAEVFAVCFLRLLVRGSTEHNQHLARSQIAKLATGLQSPCLLLLKLQAAASSIPP